jgi:RNA polymerase sigma-70 factor (ECF subfamily)
MAEEPERISREAALFLTWLHVEEHEAAHPEQRYATVLHLRQSRPKAPIEELAREFSNICGSVVSPESFRKLLQRARYKFGEFFTGLGHGRP